MKSTIVTNLRQSDPWQTRGRLLAMGAVAVVAALSGLAGTAAVGRAAASTVNPTLVAHLPTNYVQYNSKNPGAFAGHPGSFAWGAATLPNGNVIVGDIFNNRILEYDTSGNPVGGPANNGVLVQTSAVKGQGQNPYGLAVDPNDWTIYAGSAQCCGVQVWTTTDHVNYTFQGFLDPTGGPSSQSSRYPARLAVDRNGTVYIGDMTLDTIAGYTRNYSVSGLASYTKAFQFGGYGTGNAQFKQPRGLALDSGTPQRLYVIDSGNYRIEVFDTSQMSNSTTHGYLYSFGSKGTTQSSFGGNLRGLAYDTAHNVLYAVDMGKQHVEEFAVNPTATTAITTVPTCAQPPAPNPACWVRNIGKADPNLANVKGCPPCAAPGDFSDGGREDTVDGAGNLWVGDMPNFRVQVFCGEGQTATSCPSSNPSKTAGVAGSFWFDDPSATASNPPVAANAATSSGSTALSLADASQKSFSASDVGQYVYIPGAVPYGTAIASVTDSTDAVLSQPATASGTGLSLFEGSAQLAAPGAFAYPEGVGVEPDGTVIVDDSHNFRLQWFSAAPNLSYEMQEGMRGRQNNYGLNYARNISVNTGDGDFAVADTYNNAVHYFQEDGTPIWQYGGNGTGTAPIAGPRQTTASSVSSPVTLPSGVGIDNSSGPNSGDIYVTDSGGKRIVVLSPTGSLIGTIVNGSNNGKSIAFKDPRGVGVDASNGDVYVADFSGKTIYHFSVTGSWSAGTAVVKLDDTITGGMTAPFDPVVDATNGYLYVSDTSAAAVLIFSTATQAPVTSFTITGQPEGLALAPNGNLFVASRSNDEVYEYCISNC